MTTPSRRPMIHMLPPLTGVARREPRPTATGVPAVFLGGCPAPYPRTRRLGAPQVMILPAACARRLEPARQRPSTNEKHNGGDDDVRELTIPGGAAGSGLARTGRCSGPEEIRSRRHRHRYQDRSDHALQRTSVGLWND